MWLQVCVNGARQDGEHPRLSSVPERMAREAAEAVTAGARAVHVHPKDDAGRDSVDRAHVARWLTAMQSACPGVPIGVTTGAWAEPDAGRRVAAIRAWTVLPDFASVNWHEAGAEDVAAALLDLGVGVEAGIWHEAGLSAWQSSSLRDHCLRALVELPDIAHAHTVRREVNSLLAGVQKVSPEMSILLHGEERSTWPAIDTALAAGLTTRVGLEDTLKLPDGSVAQGNRELVSAAIQRAEVRPG